MPRSAEQIPLASPREENEMLLPMISEAIERVILGGRYMLGPQVEAFERALSVELQVAAAVGVGSGTDALVLALLALGVGAGDEVVTVSHTAGPTVAAINMIGATPVFIDVTEQTCCMAPGLLEAAFTDRTKAIIAVHLYGHPADMISIQAIAERRGIAVIEDCAQAQGATIGGRNVGTFGDVGCLSFYPTKNLGAIGDGGAVVTNRMEIAVRLRELRTYGWSKPQYASVQFGRCTRLDEMQAAILNVKLPHLQRSITRKREIASSYYARLLELPLELPVELEGFRHAYHLFVIKSERRDALESFLNNRGIGTGRHYPYPVHMQPGLAAKARISGSLNVTERLSKTVLSLPLYSALSDNQVNRIIEETCAFFAGKP